MKSPTKGPRNPLVTVFQVDGLESFYDTLALIKEIDQRIESIPTLDGEIQIAWEELQCAPSSAT